MSTLECEHQSASTVCVQHWQGSGAGQGRVAPQHCGCKCTSDIVAACCSRVLTPCCRPPAVCLSFACRPSSQELQLLTASIRLPALGPCYLSYVCLQQDWFAAAVDTTSLARAAAFAAAGPEVRKDLVDYTATSTAAAMQVCLCFIALWSCVHNPCLVSALGSSLGVAGAEGLHVLQRHFAVGPVGVLMNPVGCAVGVFL